MAEPVKPATDSLINLLSEQFRHNQLDTRIPALIARIDAEKAKADALQKVVDAGRRKAFYYRTPEAMRIVEAMNDAAEEP